MVQIAAKERALKISELAKKELEDVGEDKAVYTSLGKM